MTMQSTTRSTLARAERDGQEWSKDDHVGSDEEWRRPHNDMAVGRTEVAKAKVSATSP